MAPELEARTPPHSAEAEQSVLGGLLMDNGAWDRVGDMLVPEDFYFADYRAIYSTIGKLVNACKPADVLTVHDAGGHSFSDLNALAQSLPSSGAIRRWAEVIKRHSLRRALMRLGADLADDAVQAEDEDLDTGALINRCCDRLMALHHGDPTHEPQPIGDLLAPWIDDLSERAQGKTDAISTGLRAVDDQLDGGVRRKEVVVLAARPSMGKSALALGLSRAMSAENVVGVLSMEDMQRMLLSRQVAASAKWNLADLRRPDRAPDAMWGAITGAMDKLARLHLYIDDDPALTLQQVHTKARQIRRKAGRLDVLVIDYLQLMEGDGETRAQELTNIARGAKRLAKDLDCAVIILSQLSRKADETNAPPRMDHLAESGGIEQAADVIGLLWREARRNPKPDNKHRAQIEFVKNKNGACGTVQLWFDGATQRFEDASHGQD